jgi:hypothetical protein
MNREIDVFPVETEFDGVTVKGICRYVGGHLQVEVTSPMDGVVSYAVRLPFSRQFYEWTIEEHAEFELESLFIDLMIVYDRLDDYRTIVKAYNAYRHKVTTRNAELRKTLAELETRYAEHTISRKEYNLQRALLEEVLTSTDFKMFKFGQALYNRHDDLSGISPFYVRQIINWIDRNPKRAEELIRTFKEHNKKCLANR